MQIWSLTLGKISSTENCPAYNYEVTKRLKMLNEITFPAFLLLSTGSFRKSEHWWAKLASPTAGSSDQAERTRTPDHASSPSSITQHCSLRGLIPTLWMAHLLLPSDFLCLITVTWVNLYRDWYSCGKKNPLINFYFSLMQPEGRVWHNFF